jgi:hypothetical protein
VRVRRRDRPPSSRAGRRTPTARCVTPRPCWSSMGLTGKSWRAVLSADRGLRRRYRQPGPSRGRPPAYDPVEVLSAFPYALTTAAPSSSAPAAPAVRWALATLVLVCAFAIPATAVAAPGDEPARPTEDQAFPGLARQARAAIAIWTSCSTSPRSRCVASCACWRRWPTGMTSRYSTARHRSRSCQRASSTRPTCCSCRSCPRRCRSERVDPTAARSASLRRDVPQRGDGSAR